MNKKLELRNQLSKMLKQINFISVTNKRQDNCRVSNFGTIMIYSYGETKRIVLWLKNIPPWSLMESFGLSLGNVIWTNNVFPGSFMKNIWIADTEGDGFEATRIHVFSVSDVSGKKRKKYKRLWRYKEVLFFCWLRCNA